MSNLIQIKRSQTTGTPPALANGELAWSFAGNTLYIGNFGVVTPIGGARYPGVLTANQALVANSTSAIDRVIANTFVTKYVTDSRGVTNPGAGYIFSVDANGNTYWEDPATVGVSPSYVQNTDSRVLSGNLHFTGANTFIDNLYSTQSTIQNLTVNGNTVIGANNLYTVSVAATISSNLVPTTDAAYNLGIVGASWNEVHTQKVTIGPATITGSSGNTINIGALVANGSITANTGVIYHGLTVGGDLVVTGNVISSNVETLTVQTPLLHLGTNNHISDTLDIGFYGDYYNGSSVAYTGLVRDASDKTFRLFYGLTDEPITYVNTASASYNQATLEAYLISGGLTTNTTQIKITANNQYKVTLIANSLTLSTPLAYNSGGTGFNTYTQGDLLVGNTTGGQGLSKLGLGTAGYILQSDGTNLVYSTLDGGTF
jgi:hypothetical protein